MSEPLKTTVYLDAADYRKLKSLAAAQGRSTATLVREAVAEYVARHGAGALRPTSIGAGNSGRKDLSVRSEDLLAGLPRGRRDAAPERPGRSARPRRSTRR